MRGTFVRFSTYVACRSMIGRRPCLRIERTRVLQAAIASCRNAESFVCANEKPAVSIAGRAQVSQLVFIRKRRRSILVLQYGCKGWKSKCHWRKYLVRSRLCQSLLIPLNSRTGKTVASAICRLDGRNIPLRGYYETVPSSGSFSYLATVYAARSCLART